MVSTVGDPKVTKMATALKFSKFMLNPGFWIVLELDL